MALHFLSLGVTEVIPQNDCINMGDTGFAERSPDLDPLCARRVSARGKCRCCLRGGSGGTPSKGITPVRNLRPRRLDVHQAALWGWHINQPAVGTLTEDMLLSGLACSPLPSRPGFLSSRRAMQGAELRALGRSACWAGASWKPWG